MMPTDATGVGVALGIAVAVLSLLLAVVGAVWWMWRRRNLLRGKITSSASQMGIAFENPSYIKEQNGDTVQVRLVLVLCR
jgi:hypothetical protein